MAKFLHFCLFFVSLLACHTAQAQYYRTITTGDWSSANTWESASDAAFTTGLTSPASSAPTSANNAISIRHAVVVSTNITADEITVTAGGSLTVSSSGVLNVANGTSDDLILARASATNLIIDGGQIICATLATLTSNGFIGITVEINNGGSITMGSSGYLNTHIDTQYISTGGGTIAFGSSAYCAIRNASGISGHFASNIAFTFTASSSSGFEFTGTSPMNAGFPASLTTVPYMFVTNTTSVTLNQSVTISYRLSMLNAGNVIVNAPYELTLTGTSNSLGNATAIITGTGTTTIASGAVIAGIGNLNGLTASSASGAIQTTTRNYSSGARYTFSGAGAQATGDFFNATTPTANSVASLSVNNASGVSLSAPVTISNSSASVSLVLTAGAFNLNGYTLTIFNLSGSGSGTITGSSSSSLVVNGSLALGRAIPFTGGASTLNNFTYNRSAAGSLGSDLTVVGTYTPTAGVFTVDTPNTLTIDGNISLPAGTAPITGTGNFALGSGANLATAHASGISGSITTTGSNTWNAGANYTFNGSGTQNMGLPAALTTMNNLTINNSSATVTLNQSIAVNGTLAVQNNDLNLNGFNVSLGTTGTVSETLPNHIIKDNTATTEANKGGYIEALNRNIAESYANVAGLRVYLMNEAGGIASYTLNSVRRYHYSADYGKGAKVIYILSTTEDLSVAGSRTYIGIDHATEETTNLLQTNTIFRWESGTGWETITTSSGCGGSIDLCTTSPQTAFSAWTVGNSDQPLPITLQSFAGKRASDREEQIRLTWETASELNNKGFEIETSQDGTNFSSLGFVEGKGTTTTRKNYTFLFEEVGEIYIRLKQIDFNGGATFSRPIFIEALDVVSAYPNPNNGAFRVRVGKDLGNVSAYLLNAQGVTVWRGILPANNAEIQTNLPKGLYYLRLASHNKTHTKKIVIE